jgi:hypothetical protein
MSVLTLSNTDEIYAHSAGARFTQHRIAHPALQNFSFGLRRLLRELGEEATQDEHWRNFTRLLKRYRFEASVAPVGFGHPRLLPPETKEALERAAWRSRMLYPQYAELCEQLVAAIVELAARNDNPLLACLNEIVPADVPLTIALKESRHILWLKEVLQNEGLDDRFLVVSEAQLRGGVCFDALACIGARQWYAPYVWRAPRARQIHWLRFAWISEQTTDAPLLHGWATVQTALRQRPQSRAGFSTPVPVNIVTHGAEADETFDADELVPRIDLTQVAHNYARHVAAEDQTHEMVAARLVQLEGRRGVFLDAEENGTVLIIDLDEDGKDRVRRVATNSIAPEIYVLLRENAGGDYLIPVADKILGARAARLRKFQRLWKERLRALVHREGEYSVIAQLKQCGAVRANETNLRNWLSEIRLLTKPILARSFS